MQPTHAIVIGASAAGGLEAVRVIVRGLPEGFEAAVLVVLHTSPQSPGILDQILPVRVRCRLSTRRTASGSDPGGSTSPLRTTT